MRRLAACVCITIIPSQNQNHVAWCCRWRAPCKGRERACDVWLKTETGLCGPRMELLRWTQVSCRLQLTFTDHVHDLNTWNGYRLGTAVAPRPGTTNRSS
jgi:hypothetical protein